MKRSLAFLMVLAMSVQAQDLAPNEGGRRSGDTPFDVGARRCLFVDDYLIDGVSGDARLALHRPVARDVALDHNVPWEGNTCGYHVVFKDGEIYRMYYRGSHYIGTADKMKTSHAWFVCYAESRDGIHWTRPALGLHEFQGSTSNNIVMAEHASHGFSVFKDANPDCDPQARYKVVTRGSFRFQSPDGIHWSAMDPAQTTPSIDGDAQTVVFWDPLRKHYVCFARGGRGGVRWIKTSTSEDFLHWTRPVLIECPDAPLVHLYTNQMIMYHRAPHMFMGFPMRFFPGRWVTGPHSGVSDGVFMTSRDGMHFRRWTEAFIRPGLQKDRWVNRNNMTACGVVESPSTIPGMPNELSLYSTEGYYEGDSCRLRRYTVRLDGFVSVNAPLSGGEMLTRPLVFAGAAPGTGAASGSVKDAAIFIDRDKPLEGEASLTIDRYPALPLVFPETRVLGSEVTFAVRIRTKKQFPYRLFGATHGHYLEPGMKELVIESSVFPTNSVYAERGFVRFVYDGVEVKQKVKSRKELSYHFAVTWQDGVVTFYMDGEKVGEGGQPGAGAMDLAAGDLRFAGLVPDVPEPRPVAKAFLGTVDDLLVLKRTLSAEEVAALADNGAEAVVDTGTDQGELYTMEGDDAGVMKDRLPADGMSNVSLTRKDGATQLLINYSTSAAGSLRCEVQGVSGTPLPGFTMEACDVIYGDHIERAVTWAGRNELEHLAGTPVRLRFELKDADVYAIRFGRPERNAD